jgi:hypothetical protein
MKKLLLILSFAILTVSAFAQSQVGIKPWNWQPPVHKGQVTTQSLNVATTASNVSVLYLNDGLSNSYTAFAYPLFQVTGLGSNKLGLFGVAAASMSSPKTSVYAGTALGYQLVHSNGWELTAYAGLKGLDLSNNFNFQSGGKGAYVFGFGLSVPIK